jgi:hypothetical protein
LALTAVANYEPFITNFSKKLVTKRFHVYICNRMVT